MGLLWSLVFPTQFLFLSSLLFSSTLINGHQCHETESNALLQFKESFVISKSASYDHFSYPKTVSWIASIDCCSWDGIECDEFTGHVIAIDLSSSQLYGSIEANSSLFSLVHLQSLDLSDNDFNHSQIPSMIGNFSQLRYLNLSHASETTFSGEIPQEISRLSNLLSLDLSSYTLSYPPNDAIIRLQLSKSTLRSLVQNTSRLEELHLSYVNISASLPDVLTNLTYLQSLDLSNCELHGEFPVGIFHLPNLRALILASNRNLNGFLPDFQSRALISKLVISQTNFSGRIPTSIGNLTALNWLSIAYCKFQGSIPSSFGKLNQLVYVNLGSNRFTIGTFPSSFVNLTKLSYLSLERCKLKGEIPSWIMNLTNLNHLNLERNSLHGEIPLSLFIMEYLRYLSLGFNLLHGEIELGLFLRMRWLSFLSLSYNRLSLHDEKGSFNATLPPLDVLYLENCNLTGVIPTWITNLTGLHSLGLRDNHLHGVIPLSLFTLEKLRRLTLAGNSLEGKFEFDMFLKFKMLNYLSLSYNKLSLLPGKGSSNGTLPPLEYASLASCKLVEFPSSLQDLNQLVFLDLSKNNFKSVIPNWIWEKTYLQSLSISLSSLTGEISPLICNLKSLGIVDLSLNKLTGTIPSCLGSSSQSLQIMKLERNKLFGHLPQMGSALKMIDVTDNNLQGELPRELVNCTSLEFLDVSYNKINDSFPYWLGSLPELKVIALGFNEFHGAINCPSVCTFPKLHILDLSHNKFSGNLSPKMIKNWKSMTNFQQKTITL